MLFFAIHCLAIGWLIVRSYFLPRVLGLGMVVAGVGYLTEGLVGLLFPTCDFAFDILWLAYLAELTLCLWLLVMGIDTGDVEARRLAQPVNTVQASSTTSRLWHRPSAR